MIIMGKSLQQISFNGAVSGILLSGNTDIENSFSETDDSCPYSITLSIPVEFRGQYFYKMFVSNYQLSVSLNACLAYDIWSSKSTSHYKKVQVGNDQEMAQSE